MRSARNHAWTIATAVLALGCACARAEAPITLRTFTLADALQFARTHQPRVRAAQANLDAARAEARVPRSQWLPTVGVSAQIFAGTANNTTGNYLSSGPIDVPRIGGTRVVATGSLRPYASTFVGAGANQELFDFGRIAAQAAAADAAADVEMQRELAVELDVTFDVEEAYFAVLAAKAVVKASDDAYERSSVHRELAKAGVDAGLRPPIELTRADADLARFDIARIRARGGLSVAQTTFADVVGVEDSAIDAAEAPSAPPDMPALESAIQRAATRDPRILAALSELRASEARTRAAGAVMRPDLMLTATVSGRAGGAPPSGNGLAADGGGVLPRVPNWDLGVVLSWPLFDATVSARVESARAQEDVRREQLALLRHEQLAEIRLAYGGVSVARTALPGLQRSVDAALANYGQAEARFKAGLGTSVELADAEAVRTDAEIQLVLGQFELARTRAAFGRATAAAL